MDEVKVESILEVGTKVTMKKIISVDSKKLQTLQEQEV